MNKIFVKEKSAADKISCEKTAPQAKNMNENENFLNFFWNEY